MKDRNVTLSNQVLCLALLSVSIVSALWQSGDPTLTLVTLALVFPVAFLSRLPERWFPMWLRQGTQALIGIGAICWCQMRVRQTTPDVALVETATLLAFGLSLSGVEREYGLLVVISLILVGFGGTSPDRTVYLLSVLAYVPLGMLFLYHTRVLRLTGPESNAALEATPGSTWRYRAIHFALFAAIAVLLIQALPQPQGRSAGVVPVSYGTTQPQEFPMLWKDWVGGAKRYIVSEEGAKTVDEGKSPSVVSKDAENLVDSAGDSEMDSREGPGSGAIGDDLVMRVKSSARLYWLAQLYDVYNGEKWTVSTLLQKAGGPEDMVATPEPRRVPQHFSIEKAVSRRLFGAYRAETWRWRQSPSYSGGEGSAAARALPPTMRFRGFGATLTRNIPALPWQYVCASGVPTEAGTTEAAAAFGRELARAEYAIIAAHEAGQRDRERSVLIASNWEFMTRYGSRAAERPKRALRLGPAGRKRRQGRRKSDAEQPVPEAVALSSPIPASEGLAYAARSGRRSEAPGGKERPWHGATARLGTSELASQRQEELSARATRETDERWGSAEFPSPYRHLEKGLISSRVSELAEQITVGHKDAVAKAGAIKDYLRGNYTYELTAPAIPPEAEVVDYFLFESRVGYCQHFAQAFVVLARCAGLPARLATGYSPGNYNVLTGSFEVYEYHAHAWSQVFCEPFGWLTFDGVPPGDMRIESKPGFLAKVLDPFGEEWEARPPEFALLKPKKVASPARKDVLEARKDKSKMSEAVEAVCREAAMEAKTVEPGPKDLAKAAVKLGKQWLLGAWKQARAGLFALLARARRVLWRIVIDFFAGFTHAGPVPALLPLAFLGGLWTLLRHQAELLARYRYWRLKRRCTRLWGTLLRTPKTEAGAVVSVAHQLVQELLAFAGLPRPGNVDTLEHAEATAQDHPVVAADLKVIAVVFARLVFSRAKVTSADSASVLESVRRIRDHFLLLASPGSSV
ncbi:MAG: transglutaminase domain-containing protein [Lentisphaerae bacterium]|nr:transglutaminase domain-containing protein [Lentisphaerota bacterium]MBT5612796.1 transglutaminase domain-containing protein [Lentisphaerota bacterium]MBT7057622.1 transglutaminase domain-containing protein [Lentisphaerota bacterium]MBT7844931.1 transglutaminase domain-containing protein [Lentisphaerota bacterium]